ncbi:MAG: hypothetical protein GC192_05530 [Bacteroidetes bacterium]|nr:hypothetical protein [Bacteroidota bacterium]
MSKKRFNPGDRVRHFIGGPIMEVQYYELDKRPYLRLFQSDSKVMCAWEEGCKTRKEVFDQDVLIKLGTNGASNQTRFEVVQGVECREIN